MQGLWSPVHAAMLCLSIHYTGTNNKGHGNQFQYQFPIPWEGPSHCCKLHPRNVQPGNIRRSRNSSNLYLQKYCMGRLRFLQHMHNAASMRYSFPRFNTPSLRQPATTSPSNSRRPREPGSEMNPFATCRSKEQANECDSIATGSQCQVRPCEGYGSETSLY